MRLLKVLQAIKDKKKAFRYLSKISRKNGHRFCPFCKSREVYRIPIIRIVVNGDINASGFLPIAGTVN